MLDSPRVGSVCFSYGYCATTARSKENWIVRGVYKKDFPMRWELSGEEGGLKQRVDVFSFKYNLNSSVTYVVWGQCSAILG